MMSDSPFGSGRKVSRRRFWRHATRACPLASDALRDRPGRLSPDTPRLAKIL